MPSSRLRLWISRAMNVFPVPDLPSRNTGSWCRAQTLMARSSRSVSGEPAWWERGPATSPCGTSSSRVMRLRLLPSRMTSPASSTWSLEALISWKCLRSSPSTSTSLRPRKLWLRELRSRYTQRWSSRNDSRPCCRDTASCGKTTVDSGALPKTYERSGYRGTIRSSMPSRWTRSALGSRYGASSSSCPGAGASNVLTPPPLVVDRSGVQWTWGSLSARMEMLVFSSDGPLSPPSCSSSPCASPPCPSSGLCRVVMRRPLRAA